MELGHVSHAYSSPSLSLPPQTCGIVTTGIMGYYIGNFANSAFYRPEIFFLLMSVFALITTFCLVLSMFLSIGTASILPRTFFVSGHVTLSGAR